MKRKIVVAVNAVVFVLIGCFLAGCGKEMETRGSKLYAPSCVTDLNVKTAQADRILLNISSDRLLAARPEARGIDNNLLYRDKDSAYCKRKASGELALYLYTYKLLNYDNDDGLSRNFLVAMRMDALSNLNYNLTFLCGVLWRIIISPRVSTSFFDWIGNIIVILFDFCLGVVMLAVGPFIGFICHPFESLANLTVGFTYFPEYGWEQYKAYVTHVNLIASAWDMIRFLYVILLRTLLFWVF